MPGEKIMTYTIIKLNDNWYSFNQLPQDNNYIKIDALRCVRLIEKQLTGQEKF